MFFCSVDPAASISKILAYSNTARRAVSYTLEKIQFKTTLGFSTNQVTCPTQTLYSTTIIHQKRTFQNVKKIKMQKNHKIRKNCKM